MHRFINRLIYISSYIMVTGTILHTASCTEATPVRQDCIDTLQQAMASASSFFVKVHAGEALALNGYTDNVEKTFLQLREADAGYVTGCTRVLARVYKESEKEKYQACIDLLINNYLHGDSAHPRLVALESLGKLGYSTPLPEIVQDAQTGEGGFKAMARWVLSNNKEQPTEDSLAALLQSEEVAHYRGAAYALRFKTSVSDNTYRQLEQGAGRLNPSETPTIYVLSALFVHAPADKKEAVKKQLLVQQQGEPAARYEICEALSLNGDTTDLTLLESYLKDTDNDVRVAAANAIIKITKRTATQ